MNSCCHGCVAPKRHVGCRAACEHWQEEELAKDLRYDARRLAYLSRPEHANQKRQRNMWIMAQKKGPVLEVRRISK